MKAIINIAGEPTLVDKPDAAAEEGQVLVDIKRTGISTGTELYRMGIAGPDTKENMGYIASGIVLENKDDVAPFKEGDIVYAGLSHGERGATTSTGVFKAPDHLDFNAIASCYWAVPAIRGIHRLAPRVYDNIAVIGQGAIGMMATQILRNVAGRLVVVDIEPNRLERATSCGADLCVNAAQDDPVEIIGDMIPEGPSRVLEASGTKAGLELAMQIVRPRGTIVSLRMHRDHAGVDFNKYMYFKDLTLIGSGAPGQPPSKEQIFNPKRAISGRPGDVHPDEWYLRREIEASLDMLARGFIRPDPVVSHTVTPEEAIGVYGKMKDRATSGEYVGVLINWE